MVSSIRIAYFNCTYTKFNCNYSVRGDSRDGPPRVLASGPMGQNPAAANIDG